VPTDDMVVVGRIGSPYGVKGWLHVQSYTTPTENLLEYAPWSWRHGKSGLWQALDIAERRAHKQAYVVRLAGLDDRDVAAKMTGGLIGVPRTRLPDVADEYYWRDLVGCRVIDTTGETLGRVGNLLETGANDVLVVKSDSSLHQELLIPFIEQFVLDVDMQSRTITADWQADWS